MSYLLRAHKTNHSFQSPSSDAALHHSTEVKGISDHCCNVSLSVRPKSQSHHPQFQESASRRHACLGREIQSYKIDYSAVLLAEIRRPAGGPAGLIGRCCSCFCFWFVLVSVLGLYLFLCPRIFASSESKSPACPPRTCTSTMYLYLYLLL